MKRMTTAIFVVILLLTTTACNREDQSITCINCNTVVSADSLFCQNCGESLSASINTTDTSTPTTTGATEGSVPTNAAESTPQTDATESITQTDTAVITTSPSGQASQNTEQVSAPPSHTHSYSSANCTQAQTCSCGATSGSALGHSWSEATCTSAQKCSRCGATNGNALGHNWSNATCTTAKQCSRCCITEGSALGHTYTSTVTPATCTAQGYTTYTCSCGDSYTSDYTSTSHSYQNYKCSACGAIDKAHAYEYLMQWVKENGISNGSYTSISYQSNNTDYELSYSANYNALSIDRGEIYNGAISFTSLHLDSYYHGTTLDECQVTGYINASSFTSNSAISYNMYTGPSDVKELVVELARISICDLLTWLDWYLSTNNVGITISDLGFRSF